MKFSRKKEDVIKAEEELIAIKQTISLEKNDTLALIIAAFTTIFPFFIAVVLFVVAVMWIIFT